MGRNDARHHSRSLHSFCHGRGFLTALGSSPEGSDCSLWCPRRWDRSSQEARWATGIGVPQGEWGAGVC